MSSFRERPLKLGLQTVIASEPVGGLRPGGDWRLSFGPREIIPPPFLIYRVTMEGGFRLVEDGLRRVVDAVAI